MEELRKLDNMEELRAKDIELRKIGSEESLNSINDLNMQVESPTPIIRVRRFHTPNTKARILKHQMEMTKKTEEHVWKSCCFQVDSRFLQFIAQFSVIILLMVFCIAMISTTEDNSVFVNILMFVAGIVLPQPKIEPKGD